MEEKDFNRKYAAMTAGDRIAFAEIYGEMKRPAYTVILRIVKRSAVAEDVMQELFLCFWQNGEREHIKKSRPYILVMVRNMAIDELRHPPALKPEEEGVSEVAISVISGESPILPQDLRITGGFRKRYLQS